MRATNKSSGYQSGATHLKIICKTSLKESADIWNSSADFQQMNFKASAEVIKYLFKYVQK